MVQDFSDDTPLICYNRINKNKLRRVGLWALNIKNAENV